MLSEGALGWNPLLLLSLTALVSSPAVAADRFSQTFCAKLDQFHDEPFDGTEQPLGRRWIEMHWQGFWPGSGHGVGLKCDASPDSASRRYCGWLAKNTSFEFPALLPKAIFKCAGHFREPAWEDWTNTVSMLRHNRRLEIEVNLTQTAAGSGVLRLSSFAQGKDEGTAPLPPLMAAEGTNSN